jgi:CO/xanthine dehydrogenase FAD-binding subunit
MFAQLHAQALAEACSQIGCPQVEYRDIGGMLAMPCRYADGTIALIALGAEAEIATTQKCARRRLKSPLPDREKQPSLKAGNSW